MQLMFSDLTLFYRTLTDRLMYDNGVRLSFAQKD